jgi:hypothetical protein
MLKLPCAGQRHGRVHLSLRVQLRDSDGACHRLGIAGDGNSLLDLPCVGQCLSCFYSVTDPDQREPRACCPGTAM